MTCVRLRKGPSWPVRRTDSPRRRPANVAGMTTRTPRRTPVRIDVGDAELEYWERGPRDAPDTILLVHAGVFGEWFRPLFDEPRSTVSASSACTAPDTAPARVPATPQPGRPRPPMLPAAAAKSASRRAHWIGHSSSACIGLQAALDAPELIEGLVLLEPAPHPAGPSSRELTRDVVGPAMAAVGAGDFALATDTFLRGIDGPGYRDVITARLGEDAFDRIVRDAAFFFTEEIGAAVEWDLDPNERPGSPSPSCS